MKAKRILLILASCFFIVFVIQCCNDKPIDDVSCNNDGPYGSDPSGAIINHTDCKNDSGGIKGEIFSSDECISFKYFPNDKILGLSHINAGFNCCPERITSDFKFTGNTISIHEHQAKAGCKCNCLYDINYELRNISPGIYHIEIVGPITDGVNKPQLEFDIDLSLETNTHCLKRGFYPWDE
ncbi:hypothetical protein ACFLSQ_11800 [Bacteroidota bacterium]